jgi:hypothetical protein
VDRGNLSHVLRRGTQGCPKAKNESTDHEDRKVRRLRLHDCGDDGKGVSGEIDASTTIDIGENKEGCSTNTSNEH